MKKQAFYLLASVLGLQVIIIAAVPILCIAQRNSECLKGRVQEHAALIVTQVMALYAAEK